MTDTAYQHHQIIHYTKHILLCVSYHLRSMHGVLILLISTVQFIKYSLTKLLQLAKILMSCCFFSESLAAILTFEVLCPNKFCLLQFTTVSSSVIQLNWSGCSWGFYSQHMGIPPTTDTIIFTSHVWKHCYVNNRKWCLWYCSCII